MFSFLYNTFIFNPLYNGLIFLMDILPWIDAGVAVVFFTIIIRLILFPLSKKAIVTQVRMKELEPELNHIKNTMKDDRQGHALKVMALYKEKKVSPFSSFFVLLLQLPIIYALYSIFIHSGLPVVNASLLYGFVDIPNVNMNFLGIIDIGPRSIIMAFVAAVAQYFQLHYSLASMTPANSTPRNGPLSQMDMAQNMTRNMKYIFPIIVFLISYNISAVVALYWTVSSLFTLGQEIVVRRHIKKHQPL
ncbi:MAG: YidC/Oxa1 family membrane protein insertase [bacterium]|nr:YidC/Oxa1 family membrane protein insertase [bacterium]